MIIALLTIPPAIANLFSKSMWKIMLIAAFLSILFTTTGLILSYTLNLTSGATIILLAGAVYIITFIVQSIWRKLRATT
jgi:zinc transport system permease protein